MMRSNETGPVTCGLCRQEFGLLEIGTHLISSHPQVGPLELWPDGGIVAYEETVTPEMFEGGTA